MIRGQSVFSESNVAAGQQTFSFEEPKEDESLVKVPNSNIRLMAKAEGYKCGDTNHFKLAIFELPQNMAMNFESEDKCIDRGSTLRCINEAMIKGNNWRFQMVRTEFCTRVTQSQCVFGGNDELDDEIRRQSIIGCLTRSIRGKNLTKIIIILAYFLI